MRIRSVQGYKAAVNRYLEVLAPYQCEYVKQQVNALLRLQIECCRSTTASAPVTPERILKTIVSEYIENYVKQPRIFYLFK